MRSLTFFLFCLGLAWAGPWMRGADDRFDRIDEALSFSSVDKTFRAKLSGLLDLEFYRVDQPAPALIFTDRHELFAPRLAVFLDARWGTHVYGFIQARADRGFDPNADTRKVRLDEYALRFKAGDEGAAVFQVGKFATLLGNWVGRHSSWDNPFIGAPLPYENVTPISDLSAPVSIGRFVAPEADEKYEYNPIVWGPSYASGAAISGSSGIFDYGVEIKNASLGSRPESWSVDQVGWDAPTYTARVGLRPDLRWKIGFSASDGAYLLPEAGSSLPRERHRRDYRQRLLAQDVSFEWHHLQVWAELFQSRYDVPGIGNVRTTAGYIETKYKVLPRLYAALRFNRQLFSTVDTGTERVSWGHDVWRVDAAAGYRLTPHAQFKIQISREERETVGLQTNLAAQFTVRF